MSRHIGISFKYLAFDYSYRVQKVSENGPESLKAIFSGAAKIGGRGFREIFAWDGDFGDVESVGKGRD